MSQIRAMMMRPDTWNEGKIVHPSRQSDPHEIVIVRSVPGLGRTVKVGEYDNDIYEYDRTRKLWRHVRHGFIRAFRMQCHKLDTHDKEIFLLSEVTANLKGLQAKLVMLDNSTINQPWTNFVRQTIGEQVTALDRVINELKKEARMHIALIINLRDSKGRVNKGVLMCRNVTALTRLVKRMENIRAMRPWIQYRREQLRRFIVMSEEELQTANRLLGVVWEMSKSNIHLNKAMRVQLGLLTTTIENLSLKPYSHLKNHLETECYEMGQYLDRDNWQSVRELAYTGYNASLLFQQRLPLELIVLWLTRARNNKQAGHEYIIDGHLFLRIKRRLFNIRTLVHDQIDDKSFTTESIRVDVVAALDEAIFWLNHQPLDYEAVLTALDNALAAI